MKNILLFTSLLFLFSCDVKKKRIPRMSAKEAAEYSIQQDTVYLRDKKIAYLNLIEWEYHNGKLIREISLVQYDKTAQDETLKLIAFIHRNHPQSKIEVKFKEDN
jgi:hypothetical protein